MNDELDDLELELRQLPGVIAVGMAQTGVRLAVQLCLDAEADADDVRVRAEVLLSAHAEGPPIVVTTAARPNPVAVDIDLAE